MSARFHVDHLRIRSTRCSGRRFRTFGRTNVWIIGDDREVAIIDPADDPASIADVVGNRNVAAVICTHGSRSHTAAAMVLGEMFHAPVLMHPADTAEWREAHGDRRFWHLYEGQRIAVAGEEIHVMHTPTTTPGSVSLHIAHLDMTFTGDSLSCPSTSRDDYWTDLAAFPPLGPRTRIHPGHGESYVLSDILPVSAHRVNRQSA